MRRDPKECVADLDAGKGRSPECTANKTAQDESGQGGEIRLAAFHDVLPTCAKQKEPATGCVGGGCCYPRGLYDGKGLGEVGYAALKDRHELVAGDMLGHVAVQVVAATLGMAHLAQDAAVGLVMPRWRVRSRWG